MLFHLKSSQPTIKVCIFIKFSETKYNRSSNYSCGQAALFALFLNVSFFTLYAELFYLCPTLTFLFWQHSKNTGFFYDQAKSLYMARWKEEMWTGLIPMKPEVDCVNMGILWPEAVLETWMHPNGITAFKCQITWCNLAHFALCSASGGHALSQPHDFTFPRN